MGADYPLYKRFYYDYQCRSMEPDRIVPDCFTFYLLSQYPLPWQPGRTLLDMIMHRGKINWIVAHILGYESFEKEMGYSEDEAEWCRKNKTSLWKTMVEMVIYMLPIPLLYVLIYARIPLFLLWVRKLLQVLEYGWGFC